MEKIKVSKELFESLNELKKLKLKISGYTENESILEIHARHKLMKEGNKYAQILKPIYKLSIYELALILEHGYELEKTPEEELLDLYHSFDCIDARKFLVIDILDILKREIKGINA